MVRAQGLDAPLYWQRGRRLGRVGRLRTVLPSVVVSGHRFGARPIYYAAARKVLPVLYRLGVPAGVLARLYGHQR